MDTVMTYENTRRIGVDLNVFVGPRENGTKLVRVRLSSCEGRYMSLELTPAEFETMVERTKEALKNAA